jgi:hypothetical protein
MDERVRRAEVLLLPAGDGLVVAVHHARDGLQRHLLRRDEAELLDAVRAFTPLDDAADALARRPGVAPGQRKRIHRVLDELVARGLLDRADPVVRGGVPEPDPVVVPQTVGLITRDRPALAARAVRSLDALAARTGRPYACVVFDDSDDGPFGELHAALAQVAIPVRHVGRADKARAADALAHAAGVPHALARFAVLGVADLVHRPGCSYNAVLLEAAHRGFAFAIDDDTVLSVAPAVGAAPARLSAAVDPTELRWYADRSAAFDAHPCDSNDPLELHARVIGRSAAALLAGSTATNADSLSPAHTRALLHGRPRAVVSSLGALGDSGSENAHYPLYVDGAGYERASRTAASWASARASRAVHRAADGLVLGLGGHFMSMAFAVDVRDVLPPFSPVFRAADSVFAQHLRQVRDDALIAHLPWAIRHDPEPRSNDAAAPSPGTTVLRGSELVGWLTANRAFGPVATAADRLDGLGRALEEAGTASSASFADFLEVRWARRASDRIRALDARLASPGVPPWVAADATAAVAQLRDSMRRAPLGGLHVRPDRIQAVLRLYGGLLRAWPALLDAARTLRPFDDLPRVRVSSSSRP